MFGSSMISEFCILREVLYFSHTVWNIPDPFLFLIPFQIIKLEQYIHSISYQEVKTVHLWLKQSQDELFLTPQTSSSNTRRRTTCSLLKKKEIIPSWLSWLQHLFSRVTISPDHISNVACICRIVLRNIRIFLDPRFFWTEVSCKLRLRKNVSVINLEKLIISIVSLSIIIYVFISIQL